MLILSLAIVPIVDAFRFGHVTQTGWFAAVAIFFGELVGFSEIITRYRDEPLRATVNRYGSAYLLINGTLSGSAFFLVHAYAAEYFQPLADKPFIQAVTAGFGAMAIFRSKLFVYHTDDGRDVPIGPDVVIGSILRIVDRKIDRMRAAVRQQLVFELAKSIAQVRGALDFDNPNSFINISLLSFQNLSTEEKQAVVARSDDLKQKFKDAPNLLKAMLLGFMLLDLGGEENLDKIMKDLKEYLEAEASAAKPSGTPGAPGAGG